MKPTRRVRPFPDVTLADCAILMNRTYFLALEEVGPIHQGCSVESAGQLILRHRPFRKAFNRLLSAERHDDFERKCQRHTSLPDEPIRTLAVTVAEDLAVTMARSLRVENFRPPFRKVYYRR